MAVKGKENICGVFLLTTKAELDTIVAAKSYGKY